jgi:hypothetical protein
MFKARAFILGICAAGVLAGVSALMAPTADAAVGAAPAAEASTVAPAYDAGSFNTNSGVSDVTGTVWFDSATSFHLTNVKLTDTLCHDNRAAEFRVIVHDMDGREIDFPWHSLIHDCTPPVIFTRLNGSISSAFIAYLQIQTNACQGGIIPSCSSSAFSRHFNDALA